jgi:glycosidase
VPPSETETKDLPTPAPTITVGPTASPFPLAVGWWDDAVCYEIFVRSFYDGDGDGIGDFKGLTSKLDYLNDGDEASSTDLGVNCVWLMPIAESPSYHGYDVTDYRKIESDYGTNEDFKTFLSEAHRRGIKVIVDLVLNHTSAEHPWFKEAASDPRSKYRDWYLWSKDDPGYAGPWGQTVWHPTGDEYFYGIFFEGMPDLNYRNPEVTKEAFDITRFWVEEMGVDGFRLDAIKHLIENGEIQEHTPETHAWLREYRTFLQSMNRGTFTVGEALGTVTDLLATYYPDQLDTFFEFSVADSILQATNDGVASLYLATVDNSTDLLPFQRFAPLLTNHDQDRAMSVMGGDRGKARIAATALLTLPGLPFVYYGEEIGMTGVKPDERIRTPMQWIGAANGGFTTGTPWQPLQDDYQAVNVAAQDTDPNSLLNLYRRLIQLHRSHPALERGSFTALESSDAAVGAFLRHTDDEDILVVLNFGAAVVEGVTLRAPRSELAAGTYQAEPLLGAPLGAPLSAGDAGAIDGYNPLQSLAPHTGYIFRLSR